VSTQSRMSAIQHAFESVLSPHKWGGLHQKGRRTCTLENVDHMINKSLLQLHSLALATPICLGRSWYEKSVPFWCTWSWCMPDAVDACTAGYQCSDIGEQWFVTCTSLVPAYRRWELHCNLWRAKAIKS